MARHNPQLHASNHEAALKAVCSVAQAARAWCKSSKTIKYHIQSDHIAARLVGRDYIISVSSAIAYFGFPVSPLDT